MRKTLGIATVLALLSTACGGLLGGGDGEERTIFVDFSHDEFNSFFLFNFPKKVAVHPGTTLVFKQTWTGEPHTVTGGTLVNEGLEDVELWNRFFEAFDALAASGAPLPSPFPPGDEAFADFADAVKEAEDTEKRDELLAAYGALRDKGAPLPDIDDPPDMPFRELVEIVDRESSGGLPFVFAEEGLAQNAGQPCFLKSGKPPQDPKKPCRDAQQKQPEFDGSHSYYNSGVIPFEGGQGNTYRVPLSDDIEPGSYRFYCAVHGPQQSTTVVVKPAAETVPSAEDVARQARREIAELTPELERQFRQATEDSVIEFQGERIEGPFAGLPGAEHAGINEFVPRRRSVRAGEPITWKFMGAEHTISFDVPEYFPVVRFQRDGTVQLNPKIEPPAGGAAAPPEDEHGEGEEPEGPQRVDGGTYDGEGFWSSGLLGAEPYVEYTVRISKPGTYRYACLIHPPMVGTLEVTA